MRIWNNGNNLLAVFVGYLTILYQLQSLFVV